MADTVTLKGKTFQLKGPTIKEGEKVPDCEVVNQELKEVRLSEYKGKWVVLLSVPSLDTPVCSTETRRFNKETSTFQKGALTICISMDLPFAQARWCGAEGIKNVITLSDFKNREFGEKCGLIIPELGLLARAVLLIDPSMTVRKFYLVKEISHEPDYATILADLKQLMATP